MELVNSILSLVRLCWAWIYFALPLKFKIIQLGSIGTRFTLGQPNTKQEKKSGILWGTCGQTLFSEHAVLNKNNIDSIEFPTKDGVPVSVNAVYLFNILVLGDYLTASEDSGWILAEFAEAEIRAILSKYTYDDFVTSLPAIEKTIKNKLNSICKKAGLGVEVVSFRINGLSCPNASIQHALGINKIIDSMRSVPAEVRELPEFAALVALVTNIPAFNPLNTNLEIESVEENYD